MAVEKMHFSMPMVAGLDGFPFTLFQAEQETFTVKPRAEQEAFTTVKARAEQEAPILKGKVKKAKPEVKGKVKKAMPEVKAKVKKATPEVKAKVEKATPEVKAKVELKTMTTEEEEALIKFVALLEKEEAFLDAKAEAEAEEQTGCGFKRKPELERDEEGAAFVAWIEATKPPTDQVECYSDGNVSDGYDSQDDAETNFGRVMARYERHVQANNARWPFLVGA